MSIVSVIMPAYNAEQYIDRAIRSVIKQTFTDWELVIIDDASVDSTSTIAQRFCQKDDRIHMHKNTLNKGVAATRNYGLDIAQGVYIAFLDSDDYWEIEKLEKQLHMMKETQAAISYTAYDVINRYDKKSSYYVPYKTTYYSLLKENTMGCSSVMLKASLLTENRFRLNYFHEDYVLWLDLLRDGLFAVGINEVLVHYQKGGRSSNKLEAAINRWKVYRRVEHQSLPKSVYYMLHYLRRGLQKHSNLYN